MNACLILAGGIGERLPGHEKPKQFIEVGGKPLINYCLKVFEQCPHIDSICIVADEKWRYITGGHIYADPGKSRQHSIYNGLLALKRLSPRKVIIHDAVRPLVTTRDIEGVIAGCEDCDGAMPALPVTDTMYRSRDGKFILETMVRSELFAGQTPECYDFGKYLGIHEKLTDEELLSSRGSSEVAVRNGLIIALCKGNPSNFKITVNEDLERFRFLIEDGGKT